jgi:hypothetical protein
MEVTLHGTGTIRIHTISDDEEEVELTYEGTFEINDLEIALGSLRMTWDSRPETA